MNAGHRRTRRAEGTRLQGDGRARPAGCGCSRQEIPLQPDMLLKADIILETRTLADWLLDPLLSARLQG